MGVRCSSLRVQSRNHPDSVWRFLIRCSCGSTEREHWKYRGLSAAVKEKESWLKCHVVTLLGVRALNFTGASSDGSKVYFTTAASLVPGDHDTENDLYMASIGCSQSSPACAVSEREVTGLTQISEDPTSGQAADVLGVVRVAPDGTRVYFVAEGDLLTGSQVAGLESESRPVPHVGAVNLYVYDSTTGDIGFVADLCSGASRSGAVKDLSCPSTTGNDEELWGGAGSNGVEAAQTAGLDGRFLVFSDLRPASRWRYERSERRVPLRC